MTDRPGVLQNKKTQQKTQQITGFLANLAPPNCRRHIPGQNQRVSECPGSHRPDVKFFSESPETKAAEKDDYPLVDFQESRRVEVVVVLLNQKQKVQLDQPSLIVQNHTCGEMDTI